MSLESIILSADLIYKEFYTHKIYNSTKNTGKESLLVLKNTLTFRDQINLNYIQWLSSYRAVNKLRLDYTKKSVTAVWRNISVSSKNHTKHSTSLFEKKWNFWMLRSVLEKKVKNKMDK
jgi:hypothetical protein